MPEHTAPGAPLRTNEFLEDAMRRWGDTVLRLALNQMGNPADAEDVFQDVFIRLLKTPTHFNDDEHLKAWLLRVTINRCHDVRKSGWKQRNEPLGDRDATFDAPNLLESDVWEAVSQLPDDLRIAVHLHYVEGYTTDEIARIVECQPATARTRLHRARAALKTILETIRSNPRKEDDDAHRSPERLRLEHAGRESVRPPAR